VKISLQKAVIPVIFLTLGILSSCSNAPQNQVATTPETTTSKTITTTIKTDSTIVDVARFINKENNVAIKGTDPVAYFTESQAMEGSEEFTYEWNGATWHFTSADNRDLFSANPEKYAPQYGGHCAWAAAQGYVADIDPTAWSILLMAVSI
jgi:YHS domain-containing protein